MRTKVMVLILMLIFQLLSLNIPVTTSSSNINEVLSVYTLSETTFLNLTITNYQVLRDNLLKLLEVSSDSSVNLSYVIVRNWKPSYLYLIHGNFFDDIKIIDYPNSKFEVKIVSPSPQDEEQAIDVIEELLFTKLIKYRDSYMGYAELERFGRFFSLILPTGNFTPMLNWVDPLAIRTLGDVLIVNISSTAKETSLKVYVIKSVSLRENRWILSSVLATTTPLQNKSGVNSSLNLIFKNSFIFSKPPTNMSGGYNSSLKSYVYRIDDPYQIESPREVEFEMYNFAPIVIINRYFNDTSFDIDDVIEVTLNISIFNIGGPVFNVTVNESDWWKINGLSLLEGETDKFFGFIDSGTYRTMKYLVKIEDGFIGDVIVDPAKIKIDFLDGLSLIYNSSSNVIHMGEQSPFLNLYITPIFDDKPSISEGFTYKVTLKNEGISVAESVIFSEFIVGDLSSGRSISINRTVKFLSLSDIGKIEFTDARYIYNNNSYELTSSSFVLIPQLDTFVSFDGRVSVTSSKVNNTVALYKIRIVNDFDERLLNTEVIVRIFGGELLNSSYNLSRMGEFYLAEDIVIKASESFTIDFNVSYYENTIQFTPLVIVKSNGYTVFKSDLDYFFNTIEIDVPDLPKFLMTDQEFSFVVRMINNFDEPIFNVTLSWFGSDDIQIFPREVSRPLIEGTLVEEFIYNFTSPTPGNYTFPDLRVSYWYLGKFRVDTLELGNVSVLSGLSLDVLDRIISVTVDENITLKIVVYSDFPRKYGNVTIVIDLPNQLEIINNTLDGGVPIEIQSIENIFSIVINPLEPGEFTLNNIYVKYIFKDEEFTSQFRGSVSLSVREVVTQAYISWFIPAILISLAIALVLRRRLYNVS